jgi:uncharacterized membrane protein HdeD (DUF308 family)
MSETLLRSWWLLALRGAIAVLFGVAAIVWPTITLIVLAALFAAFALLAGTVWIFGAIRHRKADQRWWVMLLLGAFSVGAGIAAALHPAPTTLALILLIGANALVSGVLDIVVAMRVRKYMKGELLLIVSGIASILFGLVVLLFPTGAGALALAWMTGFYAIVTGTLLIVLAIHVRSWLRINGGRSSGPAGAL